MYVFTVASRQAFQTIVRWTLYVCAWRRRRLTLSQYFPSRLSNMEQVQRATEPFT